jgi:hypothetical protein
MHSVLIGTCFRYPNWHRTRFENCAKYCCNSDGNDNGNSDGESGDSDELRRLRCEGDVAVIRQ